MSSNAYDARAVDVAVAGQVNSQDFLTQCKLEAEKNLLNGWIKIIPPETLKADNSVQLHIEGLGYQVENFLSWIRQGIEGVRIGKIAVAAAAREGWSDFEILE